MAKGWSEKDSRDFAKYADIFVPHRDEQIAELVSLIPAQRNEQFTAVEMGAGDGKLAKEVLDRFQGCRYIALDRSRLMRDKLRETLESYGDRVDIRDFELAERAWLGDLPVPVRCFLSSLVIHHLADTEKRQLFTDLADKLESVGAILIADIVKPTSQEERQRFAAEWDKIVREQSLAQTGSEEAYRLFKEEGWNYYADDEPDPYDQPSKLDDQLKWLKEAGLERAECFWLTAGHAILGGYKG